jgi:hypothetical protein
MVSEHGYPVRSREQRPCGKVFYTSYWITFELPPIDMKAASVGSLDQIVAGLRQGASGKAGTVQADAEPSAGYGNIGGHVIQPTWNPGRITHRLPPSEA